jgi:hypothetical protein
MLVNELASEWGIEIRSSGKTVWSRSTFARRPTRPVGMTEPCERSGLGARRETMVAMSATEAGADD